MLGSDYMTTFYDIPADMLIPALANRLGEVSEINAPDWSEFVKTGADREKGNRSKLETFCALESK